MSDEERRAAIADAARAVLAVLSTVRIPGVTDDQVDMRPVDLGERIGHVAGLALFVGAPAEGFNSFGILYGLGVAIGEWTKGEPDYQRAVMVEEIERGIVHGSGRPMVR